jgi:hypothetical protein
MTTGEVLDQLEIILREIEAYSKDPEMVISLCEKAMLYTDMARMKHEKGEL